MKSSRLYIGNLYYNDGLENTNTYKIDLVEKDVLLIKFNNRYIRASFINNYTDLLKLYTVLKYINILDDSAFINNMYKTNPCEKGKVFVDKDSLVRLYNYNYNMTLDEVKMTTLKYNNDL